MNRPHNALLIKVARLLDQNADELRASCAVPGEAELTWPEPDDKVRYMTLRNTADKLRALTLLDIRDL